MLLLLTVATTVTPLPPAASETAAAPIAAAVTRPLPIRHTRTAVSTVRQPLHKVCAPEIVMQGKADTMASQVWWVAHVWQHQWLTRADKGRVQGGDGQLALLL